MKAYDSYILVHIAGNQYAHLHLREKQLNVLLKLLRRDG